MAIESRSRMISFRLTDQEYDKFRHVCIARGLRNVSELVRAAVNQLVSSEDYEPATVVRQMDARLSQLEAQTAELFSIINSLRLQGSGDLTSSGTLDQAPSPPTPKN